MTGEKKILLGHGSGGKLSHELIKDMFFHHFQNPILAQFGDSAIVELPSALGGQNPKSKLRNPQSTIRTKLAFTTDSFVVKPLFFPGGDIGRLAISGTVNDLAVMGARPLFLSTAFILEEGLEMSLLERVVSSMKETAREAGVIISTGDTKVVEKGSADGLYVNTAGIGVVEDSLRISPDRIKTGDKILLSGTLGDHGVAILAARKELLEAGAYCNTPLLSDCAPLGGMIQEALGACKDIRFMRDPTRGGLATTLNEVANGRDFGILLFEESIPVREEVSAACELLGLDPMYLANEGKVVIVCPEADAGRVLDVLRRHPLGKDSAIIGEVVKGPAGRVFMKTLVGGTRVIDMPVSDPMPRIC
ncbi:MAG TPA: hydrogenase expression/formation protein HypE [Candidatus Tripitaka sp. YC43]